MIPEPGRHPAHPVVLVFLLVLSMPPYALAASGIDFAIIVDSSGSMKKTDPHNLRLTAAKLFVSLLDETDTASILSFDARVAQLSKPLAATDVNRRSLLAAIDRVPSNGRYTNLHVALEKGLEVLTRRSAPDARQVILLLSDGTMDTGDSLQDMHLDDQVRTALLPALRNRGINVYTIALTSESDLQLMDQIARDTGGTFGFALTDKDIESVMSAIIERLKGPNRLPGQELPSQEQGFLVDASVRELTIVIEKDSPEERVRVQAPDGRVYAPQNSDDEVSWLTASRFDAMTTRRVVPGTWKLLSAAGSRAKAYVMADLMLQSRAVLPRVRAGEPAVIEAWLEQQGARLSDPALLERIAVVADLTRATDNSGSRLIFTDDGSHGDRQKGDGIFSLQYTPPQTGQVRLNVVADGKTFTRASTVVFDVLPPMPPQQVQRSSPPPMAPAARKAQPERNTQVAWTQTILVLVLINLVFAGTGAVAYFLVRKHA